MALILVIDDSVDVTNLVATMLRFSGYEVMTEPSGPAGLAAIEERQPDLILCDIMMPDMDGFQVFQRVRGVRRWRSIPFAFLTALGDQQTRLSSSRLGAEAFIAKPFTRQELVAVVSGLLQRAEELRSTASSEVDTLKAQLLFMITHELNTPLSVLRMMTDSMRRDMTRLSPDQLAGYVDLLGRSTDELAYIVESMLLALQIDSGHAQSMFDGWGAAQPLRGLFDSALARVRSRIAERQVRVRMVGALNLSVYGSEDQLVQILGRVLDNAVGFSPKGETVELAVAAEGELAHISIIDKGPGMSADQIKRVFSRLSQIDRAQQEQQGIGMSLNLVKSLVEIHGGSITVQSTPGQGSTFVISLPLAEREK